MVKVLVVEDSKLFGYLVKKKIEAELDFEAQCREIQIIDKDIDHPGRVVFLDIFV